MSTELTPEAVAKHAAAWPVRIGGAMWRRVPYDRDVIQFPGFALLRAPTGAVEISWTGASWRTMGPSEAASTWIPVRPDGSDLPDLRQEYERGRAEERAAIMQGIETFNAALRRDLNRAGAWGAMGGAPEILRRLQVGEWSAKP